MLGKTLFVDGPKCFRYGHESQKSLLTVEDLRRIPFGKGVCGVSARDKKTVVVPDVSKFPTYISCSSETLSEIVVPVFDEANKLIAVLDIDSVALDSFNSQDAAELERICSVFALPKVESKRGGHH